MSGFKMFVPEKLIETRKKIQKEHTHTAELGGTDFTRNEEFYREVERVSSGRIKVYSSALTDEQVKLIIAYIPYDVFSLNLTNFYYIYKMYANMEYAAFLYSKWQNLYDLKHREYWSFLVELLDEGDIFAEYVKSVGFEPDEYRRILVSNNVAEELCRTLLKKNKDSAGIKNMLMSVSIADNSKIYSDCRLAFYTVCDKKHYLALEKEEFERILHSYEDHRLKRFMCNFVPLFDWKELREFEYLVRILKNKTGEVDSSSFRIFFAEINEQIIKKCVEWFNSYNVHQFFKGDERSEFWDRYHFDNIKYFKKSDSIMIIVDEYYIIEFLGKDMGPMYLFTEAKHPKSKIEVDAREKANSTLRGILYNKYNDEKDKRALLLERTAKMTGIQAKKQADMEFDDLHIGTMIRIEHKQEWKGKISDVLHDKGITRK